MKNEHKESKYELLLQISERINKTNGTAVLQQLAMTSMCEKLIETKFGKTTTRKKLKDNKCNKSIQRTHHAQQ